MNKNYCLYLVVCSFRAPARPFGCFRGGGVLRGTEWTNYVCFGVKGKVNYLELTADPLIFLDCCCCCAADIVDCFGGSVLLERQ